MSCSTTAGSLPLSGILDFGLICPFFLAYLWLHDVGLISTGSFFFLFRELLLLGSKPPPHMPCTMLGVPKFITC